MSYPANTNTIKHFERNNPTIKIQLYSSEVPSGNTNEIYPLYISYYKPDQYKYVINLLLI